MYNIKIADIVINIDLVYEQELSNFKKYETTLKPMFFISSKIKPIVYPKVPPKLVTEYYSLYDEDNKTIQIQKFENKDIGRIIYDGNKIIIDMPISNLTYEYLLTQYAMVHIIEASDNKILMHSSCISYKGAGFVFSAKSGTGKSTHTNLWLKNTDAKHINDDKNIIALENDELIIYGNPWSGKHFRDNNIKAPLKAIVFIYQNKTNVFKKMTPKEEMLYLLPQILLPKSNTKDSWNKIVDKILSMPCYLYGCNMENSAFEIIEKELEQYI